MIAFFEMIAAFLKSPLASTACLGNKPTFTGVVRVGMLAAVIALPLAFAYGQWWANRIDDTATKILDGIQEMKDWRIAVDAQNVNRDERIQALDATRASKGHVQGLQRQVERLDDRVLYLERR